jgi:hypothetical protein
LTPGLRSLLRPRLLTHLALRLWPRLLAHLRLRLSPGLLAHLRLRLGGRLLPHLPRRLPVILSLRRWGPGHLGFSRLEALGLLGGGLPLGSLHFLTRALGPRLRLHLGRGGTS